MSVTYATYSEFTQVYSLKGVSQTEINSYWLPHGALRVNENLGGFFTTPFSSNNHTARDLSIHFAYLGINARARTSQPQDIPIRNELEQRITDITCGNAPMILDDGSLIQSPTTKFNAWSSTQQYEPMFNVLEPEQQRVDCDYVIDELRSQT